jgi:hypothetical protein
MSDLGGLVNIGDLTKPATVLIERISDAIGGLFRPSQIRRIAEAEAQARKIKAMTQIEITQLQERAMRRFFLEEAKRQQNMESITRKALPQLKVDARPEEIEEDWITNFFDKCRLVSDVEMQDLWARVLAGQANSPGDYSKRTVNTLATLDKSDAILFTKLCDFAWEVDGTAIPLIYSVQDAVYGEQEITFDSLLLLEEIGLVSFEYLAGYRTIGLPHQVRVHYFDIPIEIHFDKEEENELNSGIVLLSQTGRELARVCDSKPVPGFLEYVLDYWATQCAGLSSPYPRGTQNA